MTDDAKRNSAETSPPSPLAPQQQADGAVLVSPPQKALHQRILKAGFLVLLAHLLLKVCGLALNKVIPNVYGGEVSDVFVFVYGAILGKAFSFGEQCLAPALLPVFAAARDKEGEARAWRYVSVLFNLQFLILAAVTVSLMFFAKPILGTLTQWDAPKMTLRTATATYSGEVQAIDERAFTLDVNGVTKAVPFAEITAPEFTSAQLKTLRKELEQKSARRDLGGKMLPYIAPGLLGMSLASLTYVILNGYKEFFLAAFGDAVLKLCILLGALIGMFIRHDWRFIAAGAVIGGSAKLATHLFALGRKRVTLYQFSFDLSDPYLRTFILLVLPLLAGIFVSSIRDLVISNVLTAKAWLPTYFQMGKQVVDSIGFLVPYTLSIALLPYFCDLSARNDNAQLGAVLTRTIRMLLWFFVPVTIVLAVAALPVCFVFFSGKEIDYQQVKYPALVMRLFALQLPFAALEMMVMQAFFSNRRMIAPTVAGFVFSVLTAGMAWWLVVARGMDDTAEILLTVALCVVLGRALKACLLVGLLKSTVPVLPWLETLKFLGRLALAGGAAAGAAYGASRLFTAFAPAALLHSEKNAAVGEHLARTLEAGLIAAAGAAIYLLCSHVLRMEEPRLCWQWAREKLKRRRGAAGAQ